MREAEVEAMLSSADPDVVLEGLFALGAERETFPGDVVLRRVVALFRHEDSDVRREAVLAAGVHWGYVPAFRELASLLRVEQVGYVAHAIVSAIACLAFADPSLREDALEELRRVALADDRAETIRRKAFVDLRWLLGKTTTAEHARELVTLPAVDREWLRNLGGLPRKGP